MNMNILLYTHLTTSILQYAFTYSVIDYHNTCCKTSTSFFLVLTSFKTRGSWFKTHVHKQHVQFNNKQNTLDWSGRVGWYSKTAFTDACDVAVQLKEDRGYI